MAATSRAVTLRRDLQSLFLSDLAAHPVTEEATDLLADSMEAGEASLADAMILPAMKEELEEERAELSQPPAAPAKRSDLRAKRLWLRPWSGRACAAMIALPVLLGVGLTWMLLQQRHSPPAALGVCVDVSWSAPYQNLSSGQAMPDGPVHLLSGFAEVHFKNGVSVVLQAPARFQVHGTNQGELSAGKLTALVPKGIDGFTVETSAARIVDLGTEFGVSVDADEQTHVEVFRGQVRAELSGEAADAAVTQTLGANEAVNIPRRAGSIEMTAAMPLSFVRIDALQHLAAAGDSTAERWRGRSEALRNDPATVAYYTFDNADEAPDRLLNRATATAGAFDGRLGDAQPGHDPRWATGRWPGKGALQFEVARRTCVTLPKIPDFLNAANITVAMWILPGDPAHTSHLLDEARGMQNRFDLVWIGADDPAFPTYDLYFNRGGGEIGMPEILPHEKRWAFVALTEDAVGNVTAYLDGRQAALIRGARAEAGCRPADRTAVIQRCHHPGSSV